MKRLVVIKNLLGKRWIQGLLALLLVVSIAIEIPIIQAGMNHQPEPGDVIIILGAKLLGNKPSSLLQSRLDMGIRLYQAGYAPKIIVSGAKGQDELVSEAAAMRDYLVREGIPSTDILIEDQSFNTLQNLTFSKAIMKKEGFGNAIIVTNASHVHRSMTLASILGIKASAAPASMLANTRTILYQYFREGAAMAALSIFPPKP